MDFDRRQSRLEQDQERRRREAQKRLEAERRASAVAKAHAAAIEQQLREKRAEEALAHEEVGTNTH